LTRSVFSDAYRRMCEVLVAGRRFRGLTQAELAGALGRPQSFVAKYERGERRLDVVELLEIVAILELDPAMVVADITSRMPERDGRGH